jgi:lipopolysaccharide export system protein LptA
MPEISQHSIDLTSGNVIINLPATGGQPITIKRIDATANTITL